MLENILNKCREIKNDRNLKSIFKHLESEIEELREELDNGDTGVDGVVGESVDIILCALDIIASHKKDLTEEQLDVIFNSKYDKWKRLYSKKNII